MVDLLGVPIRGYHVAWQIERSFGLDSSHAYSLAFHLASHHCIVVALGPDVVWPLAVVPTFAVASTEDARSSSAAVGTLLLAPVDLDSNAVKHVHLVRQLQVAYQPS